MCSKIPTLHRASINTPPSSLMDSTLNPKVEIPEGKRVGACSLARNTLGVKGRVRAPRWGLRRLISNSIIHTNQTNQTKSWLVHSWNTFGARMNHEQTQTHKTHHDSNLGEATTFPLIVFSVLGHKANTQMSFCLGTPKWESRNSQNWDSLDFGVP